MADEAKLLLRLKNKEHNSINEGNKHLHSVFEYGLYNMAGNRLPKEDIEEISVRCIYCPVAKCRRYRFAKGTLRSNIAAAARNFALKRLNKQTNYTSLDDIELSDESSAVEKA